MATPSRELERSLTKAGGRPLYQQLYDLLRARVLSGELKAGDLVPPESELTQTYGVSRITVRAALDQLVQEGIIDRHRGRGSFVRAAPPEARACLTSFTDQVLRSGRVPTTDVVGLRTAPARDFGPTPLPFDPDESIVLIERRRRVDGDPVVLVRSYLPARLLPGVGPHDFGGAGPAQSLPYVLEHRFGVVLDKGEETLVPSTVTPADADLLGIAPGSPVAIRICLVDDLAGSVCLYEEAVWCAPQTQLVQRLCVPAVP